MTPESRKRLRELALAATPGEWIARISDHKDIPSRVGSIETDEWFCEVRHAPKFRYRDGYEEGSMMSDNASFISAANPQTILSLLDLVERLERYETAAKNFTCYKCPSSEDGSCKFAWDPYNTNGDCLDEK